MELWWSHIIHLYNVFRENDGNGNCAQLIEEEFYKMFDKKSLNDDHDCNIVGMNSLNIHDANDMQSHKLRDALFDEDDIFVPQVLMRKCVMMIACLLFMMIIFMKVDLERS